MKNCLLTAPLTGAFWLIFLFVVCFLGVHLVRLAKIGWKYQKDRNDTNRPPQPSERTREDSSSRAGNPPDAPQPEKKDEPAKGPPEPVYYIVERKRKRTRDSYSPPKEIKFK